MIAANTGPLTPMRWAWFAAGLVLVAVFGTYAPKFAGAAVILIAIVLALELSNLKLI